ncbi:hypothetical protein DPMN_131221 [Dreissena polymorpha]|uniref:Uncharacterized protein n=1 Tax=Dreissena polymorpha TaxID=45954 RepID=A0A9D4H6K1_DREPO|nr:hypothetical protein DPMN_131221 [Dreissena polymorpha]
MQKMCIRECTIVMRRALATCTIGVDTILNGLKLSPLLGEVEQQKNTTLRHRTTSGQIHTTQCKFWRELDHLQIWTTFRVRTTFPPPELDDLQRWTTFRVGRSSEVSRTFRVGPPSELDDLQSLTTFRAEQPLELGHLQSWTTFRVGRPSELDHFQSWTTLRVDDLLS